MISDSTIEEVKNLDIVDLVSHYVELKRVGNRFTGLSPINFEKTPSFHVDPSGRWYDFSAGIGGNIISFVMTVENLTFPEAIEKLANMYSIIVKYSGNKEPSISSAPLEMYNDWCIENIKNRPDVMKYLHERGLTTDTIEKFEIGFSPSSREIVSFINGSVIAEPMAIELGIIDHGESGLYGRFVDRIMFPVRDVSGKLCGFSGRTIKNHPAKYVNTKDTPLFKKHRLMYGFDKAKESIIKHKFFVLSEGQMDVVMQHQIGLHYTFASMGTSLTDSHIKTIKRFASNGVIAYDGDRAGIEAAFKAATLCMQSMIDVTVVIFDDGEDPADMVSSGRGSELADMLKNGVTGIQFCLNRIFIKYDLSNPFEKSNAWEEIEGFAKSMPPMIMTAIFESASEKLGVIRSTPVISSGSEGKAPVGNLRELELIKYAVMAGTDDVIDELLSAEKCFSSKLEIDALKRKEFDHDTLARIFLDDTIQASRHFESDILIFKQWCLKRFINTVQNSSTMSAIDKLKKIRTAQAKINEIKEKEVRL